MSTAQQVDPRAAASGRWLRDTPTGRRVADVRLARRLSLQLVIPVALRVLPGPTKILAYVWAMGYALMGRRQAILALVLVWFFNMFTHAFGYPPAAAAVFRHLTVFAAALSVFVIYASEPPRSRTPNLLLWTAALNAVLILHSLFCSTMPDISALKAILFSMTIQALLVAWSRLSPQQRSVTENQLWGLLVGVAVLSAPLLATKSGYFKNGRGFQGLLEHPQTFGPTMAIVAVWLFATWLVDRQMRPALKAVLGLTLACVYLSGARIAALVLFVGVAAVIAAGPLTALMNQSSRVPKILKGRLTTVVAGVILLVAAAGPFMSDRVTQFITKTGKSTTAIDAAWESRGHLIEMMQANIRDRPVTGIGLGVVSSSEQYSAVIRDPIFGLPIMATVEKGVLPVAMVEEMGWPLALLYAPWFLALLLMAVRAGPRYAGVCAAALTVNISEAVFFSPGGGGLMIQVLVAMAATAPPAREDPIVAPVSTPPALSAALRVRASD